MSLIASLLNDFDSFSILALVAYKTTILKGIYVFVTYSNSYLRSILFSMDIFLKRGENPFRIENKRREKRNSKIDIHKCR